MIETEIKHNGNISAVVMKIDNEKYLIEVNEVKEIIIPGDKIVPVPLAQKSIVGIIDIRGEIYTIISLKHVIKENGANLKIDNNSRIILIEYEGLKVAILVDSVTGVIEMPVTSFNSSGTIVETKIDYRFIKSIGVHEGDTFILINLKSLIKPYILSLEKSMMPIIHHKKVESLNNQQEHNFMMENRPKAPVISPIEMQSADSIVYKPKVRKSTTADILLSGEQQDTLKEIGNIGSGNAVTALSHLIKKKIDVNLTEVNLISFDEMSNLFGNRKNKVCGIFSHIEKSLSSTILQVFDMKPLVKLIADLAKGKSTIDPNKVRSKADLDDFAVSTIVEMGNILSGHYASALSDLTGIKMMIEVPEFAMSEYRLLGEFLSRELESEAKYIIMIRTAIDIVDLELNGMFIFIPDSEILKVLFQKLGIDDNLLENKLKNKANQKKQPKKLEDIKLTDIQRDALQEVGNIGAGNAANALATMINRRVDINIPAVKMVNLDDFAKEISTKDNNLLVAWSNVSGKTRATILSIFKVRDIIDLTAIIVDDKEKKGIDLRKKYENTDDFPEIYLDAMKELGHILGSNYASALGDLLELRLMTDPPDMSIDNGAELFKILKEEIGLLRKLSLVITTNVIITDIKVTGTFLYIPELETLNELLNALERFYD